ncbi:MAG: heterodisulfide reductase-related iron-sulfur binding cluster [Anaerolineae bacterium]|nr:heterodisulfide reductase-related iron-sulfur binding cluster [Anaerolineae bacterium]
MSETVTQVRPDLARLIQERMGENVFLCYQCGKCTSGCPVGEFFDWQPHQIMRAVQLGQEDIALESGTPWLCASCQTCTTRCPQGLDIAGIMENLTQIALARGIRPKVPEADLFNKAFLREVSMWGRAYEPGLIVEFNLRSGNLLNNMDLGVRMMRKGKVKYLPGLNRPPRRARPVRGAEGAVAYYPGCSLHSTATEYNTSARAVAEALGLRFIEPKGWICCGATAAHKTDADLALRLPMHNLALIEQSGFTQVVMPCAACFNRHKAALHEIRQHPERHEWVNEALDYPYEDRVDVISMNSLIFQQARAGALADRVKQPLKGLKVVCYYGCLLTRPPEVTEAPHPENPTDIDEILRALGADVIDWSDKTRCCGASHALGKPDIVLALSGQLIEDARAAGADVIALACPMCHANLDGRQFQMDLAQTIPVLYFTQLMALAFGLGARAAALHKNLVDPRPLLEERGFV